MAHVRGYLSRKRVKKLMYAIPRVVYITLHNSQEIRCQDNLTVPSAYLNINSIIPSKNNNYQCYSTYLTKEILKNPNPVWNEECKLFIDGTGHIVINLFSKSSKDNEVLLGQAKIKLSDFPDLYTRRFLKLTLPIEEKCFPIYNIDGKEMSLKNTRPSNGSISVSIRMPPICKSMCGWFWNIKESTSLFLGSSTTGEKMWVILCEDVLLCFEKSNTFNSSSNFERKLIRKIEISSIESVEQSTYDKIQIKFDKINIKLSNGEILLWGWGDDSKSIKGLWKKALTPLNYEVVLSTPSPKKNKIRSTMSS